MVVIRLARIGSTHYPKYRVTVADSRRAATGKHIDVVGHFNPFVKDINKGLSLDMDRVKSWMAKGAQPTRRVRSLMVKVNSTKESKIESRTDSTMESKADSKE